jgi:hypothetical protein
MNYETAKKLKDAGFPFRRCEYAAPSGNWAGECACCGTATSSPGPSQVVPTLEELIEACGDKFSKLWKMPGGKWGACNPTWDMDWVGTDEEPERAHACKGDTPKAALAALYLALKADSLTKEE